MLVTYPNHLSSAWDAIESAARAETQETLQVVMDYCDSVYPITNNAVWLYISYNFLADISQASRSPAHGTRGGERGPTKTHPRGEMYGIGWHLSQEAGKTLVNYAPKDKDEVSMKTYVIHLPGLSLVSLCSLPATSALLQSYPRSLPCIATGFHVFFLGVQMRCKEWRTGMLYLSYCVLLYTLFREAVLSLGDALDGTNVQRPFANSLTATKLGFCNFQHWDNDKAPIAFGMWWEAETGQRGKKCRFPKDADHEKTVGGEFIWGAFGIGVDFQRFVFFFQVDPHSYYYRARGLVEIFWRGKVDFHGTLESSDEDGYTRFGTSIQITAKGVNAMQKVWNVEELARSGHDVHRLAPKSSSRITTAQDRAERAVSIHIRIHSAVPKTRPRRGVPCRNPTT